MAFLEEHTAPSSSRHRTAQHITPPPLIMEGSQDTQHITNAQIMLAKLGYIKPDEINGKWTDQMGEAVHKFQEDHKKDYHLTDDKKMGTHTWAALTEQFQIAYNNDHKDRPILKDGIVGEQTTGALAAEKQAMLEHASTAAGLLAAATIPTVTVTARHEAEKSTEIPHPAIALQPPAQQSGLALPKVDLAALGIKLSPNESLKIADQHLIDAAIAAAAQNVLMHNGQEAAADRYAARAENEKTVVRSVFGTTPDGKDVVTSELDRMGLIDTIHKLATDPGFIRQTLTLVGVNPNETTAPPSTPMAERTVPADGRKV